ncbi:MAG: insulinase family protein [Clostridiales bacterium]|nr:insulinase family protein [Clostridiales bacterium]
MNSTIYRNQRTDETCHRIDHPSGLTIFVCPKPGYRSCYAALATRYGSIDTTCLNEKGMAEPVPEGIAHYLEHKLFESEDGDAFARYAETGASANAYTSFDHTAYLFTCTDRLEDNLEILLDFVRHPYFTEETVQKEQGIIGQEIRMLEDNPGRRCLFNLLRTLYSRHPARIDIGGTVESIARITPQLLYDCYRTYYDLHNMALAVSGDITVEQVTAVADRVLGAGHDAGGPQKRAAVLRTPPVPSLTEPEAVEESRVEQAMPVSAPLFYYGYKKTIPEEEAGRVQSPAELAGAAVLSELLAGKASPLYARLMEAGLINTSFGADLFDGPGYAVFLFAGESADPDRVCEEIRAEINRLRREGIAPADFEAARRAVYGRMVAGLNDVENCADARISDLFNGREPFALIDETATLGVQLVTKLLDEDLRDECAAVSIVRPA